MTNVLVMADGGTDYQKIQIHSFEQQTRDILCRCAMQ